jgi:hypothetical protein
LSPAAVRQRRLVEGLHHGLVFRLERQVDAAGQFALNFGASGRGDEQFVGPEVLVVGSADGNLQRIEDRGVERLAGGQVAHHQSDVVDQTALVSFLLRHESLRAGIFIQSCPAMARMGWQVSSFFFFSILVQHLARLGVCAQIRRVVDQRRYAGLARGLLLFSAS